ncbi:MAG: hypothetical protein ABH828_03525 [archaeon]
MKNRTEYVIIIGMIFLIALAIVAKLVYAAIYYAEGTADVGTSLSSSSYTNNSVYDGPTAVGSWAASYVHNFGVTGRTEAITNVKVCFDLYTTFTVCSGQCDNFYLQYSLNGAEGSPTTLETITAASIDYRDSSPSGHKCHDITSAIGTWTWSDVNGVNIHIGVAKNQGPDTFTLASDYLYVKVTYTAADTTDPVVVSLDYPGTDTYVKTNIVDFNFTATDDTIIGNCTLWGNFSSLWTANQTIYSVTNNTETNITIRVDDGAYEWNVKCYDGNSNSDIYNNNYTVKVDTTVPTIWLENPEDNNYTEEAENNFYFNVTDIMTNITSCELIIDDIIVDTTSASPVAEAQTITLSGTLSSGDHYWWINCTDSNGWENMSLKRNISVNVLTATIYTQVASYTQGGTAIILGENWDPNQDVTINITLINGSNYIFNTTSDGLGQVSTEYNISYDHPLGQQNISAFQFSDPGINSTGYFTVTERTAVITLDELDYAEGEAVFLNGSLFSPNGTIYINFSRSSGSEVFNVDANANGEFNFTYNLTYTETLGLWNVSVYDTVFRNLNDTDNFIVSNRVANIYTDKLIYGSTETVYLYGTNFSSYGSILVTLKDIDADAVAPGYPQIIFAASRGAISHSWLIDNTCAGNYSFNAYDQDHTELNDTTGFNITPTIESSISLPNVAYRNSPAGVVDVGLINTTNNQYGTVTLNTKSVDLFLEANYSNSFSPGTVIESAELILEHYEGDAASSVNIDWYNSTAGAYQRLVCTGITNIQTEANQTCDLTDYVNTYTKANDISLRVVYRYSTGGGSTVYIDYVRINITYSGASACTEWGNTAPTITDVLLAPSSSLYAGQTRTIYCNATITDTQDDMISANATLFYYLNSSDQLDDNNDHYTNSSCTYTGSVTKTAVCSFDVWYYANNGTWYCNVSAIDFDGLSDYHYNETIIDPLYALNITPDMIDYGNVQLGGYSQNQTVNISNIGNRPLNISVWGYGGTTDNATGGELSFICDQQGNITVKYEKYSVNASHNYFSKTRLSSGPYLIPTTIPKQIQPGVYSWNSTYWELEVSNDNTPIGKCNGTLIFTAEVS